MLSEELKKSWVDNVMASGVGILRNAPQEVFCDGEYILQLVNMFGLNVLNQVPVELRANKDFMYDFVKSNGFALGYASIELRDDRELVLAAVTRNGEALQFASERLRGDKEIVLTAVKQGGFALEYASEALQADESVKRAAEEAKDDFADEIAKALGIEI